MNDYSQKYRIHEIFNIHNHYLHVHSFPYSMQNIAKFQPVWITMWRSYGENIFEFVIKFFDLMCTCTTMPNFSFYEDLLVINIDPHIDSHLPLIIIYDFHRPPAGPVMPIYELFQCPWEIRIFRLIFSKPVQVFDCQRWIWLSNKPWLGLQKMCAECKYILSIFAAQTILICCMTYC